MGTFRGLICTNDADFNAKNNALFNVINAFETTDEDGNKHRKCTSEAYSGVDGKANIYTIDGKPILVEPKDVDFLNESKKIPLPFTDLDTSIIRKEL
jgi:hypothetical protein